MFKMRVILMGLILSVALLGAASVDAQDKRLTRSFVFAPFQGLDSEVTQRLPAPRIDRRHKIKPFARASSNPNVPMITPEDTLALIEQLYENEDFSPSPLEEFYSRRIIEDLNQFGYEMFATAGRDDEISSNAANPFALPAGAVQDDFVLSIGDRVSITLRGEKNETKAYTITSAGQLIIDDMPPIPAAGQTMGALRGLLEAQTDRLYNTDIFVSLESVRQANILVLGHVEKPGQQVLTVFSSVIDALMGAGGIQKTGSLRQVKLVRNGRSTIVDLYSLLIHGSAIMDISLRDGDRIIVPPIGPTVAVAGSVKRAGIYEILPQRTGYLNGPNQDGLSQSLQSMLNLAGGVLNPGQNRYIKLGLTKDGHETVEDIKNVHTATFRSGSILMVAPSEETRTGTIELAGHTRKPGLHALDQTATLSSLIDSETVFGPDIYPLIGVIERRNEEQFSRQLLDFPPLRVLKGDFDRTLQDGDVVHLFSNEQIRSLYISQNINAVITNDEIANNRPVQRMDIAYGSAYSSADDDNILLTDPLVSTYLSERSAFIRGAVRQEGAYPIAEGTTLDNLIAVAGGLTLEAHTGAIEVTSKLQGLGVQKGREGSLQRKHIDLAEVNPRDILVGPGDTVRANQRFKKVAEQSVMIIGEVMRPGHYDLIPGETLSELLHRAGGLTFEAYPDGAIFSRASERKAEEARFRAQAQELEVKLAAALQQEDEPNISEIAAVEDLITQLKQTEGVGRITVEADPANLAIQPELDILLESNDRIYIPKRPLTVRVAGEILSPAALQFRKDKDPRDYIMEGGGFTYHADKGRTFVLYPDGSAQPVAVNSWSHNPVFVPPGSTLVVPRDPEPFNFIQTARDVSQILSNLAITGIFLDDISND